MAKIRSHQRTLAKGIVRVIVLVLFMAGFAFLLSLL